VPARADDQRSACRTARNDIPPSIRHKGLAPRERRRWLPNKLPWGGRCSRCRWLTRLGEEAGLRLMPVETLNTTDQPGRNLPCP